MSPDDYVSIALNHVRLVLEFVRSIQADERIDAILAIIGNGRRVRVRPNVYINIRSGPTTNYKRVGIARPGEVYPILEQTAAWIRIGPDRWMVFSERFLEVIEG